MSISTKDIRAGIATLAEWVASEEFAPCVAPMASVGRTADLYHDVRELRLAAEKVAEALAKQERELRESIIERLSKSEDSGAAGLRYRAQRVEKTVYRAAEWPKIWAWIVENGRTDMVQKRLADKAVADYVEQEGKLLPGTEKIIVPDVSITKI